jgi:hypothetical protein
MWYAYHKHYLLIGENIMFVDDKEKMADFELLSKEEFLKSYSYLTEKEYDYTVNFLNNKGEK